MSRLFRRSALAFVAGALLVAVALAGRAASASLADDVVNACFKPSNGTLYLIGGDSDRTGCQPGDEPISWSVQGPPGEDGAEGVSVTSVALAAGVDPNCPLGGSKFTSASGITYACNGGFTGASTSPNGAYSISLENTGIELDGPTGHVRITNSGIVVESTGTVSIKGSKVEIN